MGFRGSRVQIPPSRYNGFKSNDLRRPRPAQVVLLNIHHAGNALAPLSGVDRQFTPPRSLQPRAIMEFDDVLCLLPVIIAPVLRRPGGRCTDNDAVKGLAMAEAVAGRRVAVRATNVRGRLQGLARSHQQPIHRRLDNTTTYVASSTLQEPLPWKNSVLVAGDVPADVSRLREARAKDLIILGGGEQVRSLMRRKPDRRVRAGDPPAGARRGRPHVPERWRARETEA